MKSFGSKPYDHRIYGLLLAAWLTLMLVWDPAHLKFALFAPLRLLLTGLTSFVFRHSTAQRLAHAWLHWMGKGLPDK